MHPNHLYFFKTLGICSAECCEFTMQVLRVGFISAGMRAMVRKTTTAIVTFGSEFLKRAARMFSMYQFVGSLLKVFIYSLESHQKRHSMFSERLCNMN